MKLTCGGGWKVQPEACLRRRDAGQPERDVRGNDAADQDDGQSKRRAGTVPGQIEYKRHQASGRELR